LIYLTEKEFKFLKILKKNFLRKTQKFFKKENASQRISPDRTVERRFQEKQENDWAKSRYKTSDIAERRKEALYWSWQRVKEYYREMTIDERYEKLFKEIKI